MTKIYHPDHGFVFSGDEAEIAALVAKGGKIVIKNSEIDKKPELPKAPPVPNRQRPVMKLDKHQHMKAAQELSKTTAFILENGTN